MAGIQTHCKRSGSFGLFISETFVSIHIDTLNLSLEFFVSNTFVNIIVNGFPTNRPEPSQLWN